VEQQPRNFKHLQQDLTELNSDGNRTRGRYGEDNEPEEERRLVETLGEIARGESRGD
jgi:hypothetical protein